MYLFSAIAYNVLIANEYFKLICDNNLVNETRVTIAKASYIRCESQNEYTYQTYISRR